MDHQKFTRFFFFSIVNLEQSSLAAADTARSPSPEASRYDPNLKGPPQACLFVASLSLSTTEDALHQFFSPYGEIVKIKILKDRSSRPYAFIQYKVQLKNFNQFLSKFIQRIKKKRLLMKPIMHLYILIIKF